MATRKRIIVTSGLSVEQVETPSVEVIRYLEALDSAGAEPILIAKGDATAHALHRIGGRGVLFTGGGDIDAHYYGGDARLCVRVDMERDKGELALFQNAYFNNVPILGICRGMELANVALGGSLFEDVTGHRSGAGLDRFKHCHIIRVDANTLLARIIGKSIRKVRVNSVHHQAIRRLAHQFVAVASSEDGVIEAIESEPQHPGFFLGIQWHPEAMLPGNRIARAIFSTFVEACQARGFRNSNNLE